MDFFHESVGSTLYVTVMCLRVEYDSANDSWLVMGDPMKSNEDRRTREWRCRFDTYHIAEKTDEQ